MNWPLGMRCGLAAAAVAVTLAAATGCKRSEAAPATSERVFVSNEDSGDVSVIDVASDCVVATIPVGQRPRGLRVSADGRRLYVALSGSPKAGPHADESQLPAADRAADGIGEVDLGAGRLLRVLSSGVDPEAFDIADQKLFVSNEETGRASIVGLRSGRVDATLTVGAEPEGVTTSPDGRSVFVTSEASGEVHVIDPALERVVARLAVGARPRSVAFTPDGARAYVTNELGASISVIDVRRRQVRGKIELPRSSSGGEPRPMGIVISPEGERGYVTTGRGTSVCELDLRDDSVARCLAGVGPRPWGIAITADGKRLYVANGPSNDVAVIDTKGFRVERRLPVGRSPWGISISRVRSP